MGRVQPLRVLQWNVKGLRTRLADLLLLLARYQPHVLLLCETFLAFSTKITIPGYSILRCDRPNGRGGGVAIAVCSTLSFRELTVPDCDSEVVAAQVFAPGLAIAFLSVYRANPSQGVRTLDPVVSALPRPLFIGGDFNAHHQLWGCARDDSAGRDLFDSFVDQQGLNLLNDGSITFLSPSSGAFSALDLSFCSPTLSLAANWQVLADVSASDHFPVLTTLDAPAPPPSVSRAQLLTRSADWPQFAALVSESLRSGVLGSVSVNDGATLIGSAIKEAARCTIPSVAPDAPEKRRPKWWTADVRKAIACRNKARLLARRRPSESTRLAYRIAYAKARRTLREARAASWRGRCDSLETKGLSCSWLWRMARGESGFKTTLPPLVSETGALVTDGAEKAALLLSVFFVSDPSCLDRRAALAAIPFAYRGDRDRYNLPFQLRELQEVLSGLRNTAPGPDGVTNAMLRNLDDDGLSALLSFFNQCFSSGCCPADWKAARVVPLRKVSKPASSPEGYRPVSLSSSVGKLMERMVLRRLEWYMNHRNLFSKNQYGFSAGRSTTEPLLRLVSEAKCCLKQRRYMIVVFLDIHKAFDGIFHEAILAKLRLLGIRGALYNWIASFLRRRVYELALDGEVASVSPEQGVPQGSCLSPRLFNLVMDDLARVLPPEVAAALFADDGTLWVCSLSLSSAVASAQRALDAADAYGEEWGLPISARKTDFLVVSSRPVGPTDVVLTLRGKPLERVRSKRVLGLVIDDKLTWKDHVDHVKLRCAPAVSLLRCLSGTDWGGRRDALLTVFRALVLSRLDYASPVFADLAKCHAAKLASVQSSALRAVARVPAGTANAAVQVELGVEPLHLRRAFVTSCYLLRVASRFPNLLKKFKAPDRYEWREGQRPTYAVHVESCEKAGLTDPLRVVEKTFLFPLSAPWRPQPPSVCFLTDWLDGPRASFSLPVLRDRALAVLASVRPASVFFCDGSKDPVSGLCGIGVYGEQGDWRLSERLSDELCIASCELYAVLFALREAPCDGPVVVVSDSLTALTMLQDGHASSELVRLIVRTAEDMPRVTFLWVPSHCGISGNEEADSLARSSLSLPAARSVPLPFLDARASLRRGFRSLWSAFWSSQDTGRVQFSVKPEPGKWMYDLALSREEEVVLALLRCGRAKLPAFEFRVGRADTSLCEHCRQLGDGEHLLVNCELYADEREELRNVVSSLSLPFSFRTLLGGADTSVSNNNRVLKATLAFLRATVGLKPLRVPSRLR